MLSRRRRSTALCDSRRLRRFSEMGSLRSPSQDASVSTRSGAEFERTGTHPLLSASSSSTSSNPLFFLDPPAELTLTPKLPDAPVIPAGAEAGIPTPLEGLQPVSGSARGDVGLPIASEVGGT